MKQIRAILTIAICLTALGGDYIVFKSKYSRSQVFRAIADSIVHASIGLLSSLIFFSHKISVTNQAWACNVIFCTFVSSLIDIDHFLVAKSLYLKDLINLKQRGFLHCTTFCLAITSLLLTYSYIYKKINIYILTWMFVLAFTSHHIRDANRRGLWIYPFGHTPALTRSFYVVLVALLPNVIAYICMWLKPVHDIVVYHIV